MEEAYRSALAKQLANGSSVRRAWVPIPRASSSSCLFCRRRVAIACRLPLSRMECKTHSNTARRRDRIFGLLTWRMASGTR